MKINASNELFYQLIVFWQGSKNLMDYGFNFDYVSGGVSKECSSLVSPLQTFPIE
jgi:hypothetical protein